MKKITFSISLSLMALAGFSQKTIVVNGGQFGNPSENVNVNIYDVSSKTSVTIDTIHTNSVQDILIEGDIAYVAAQDSIVRYNLITEQRTAAAKFAGVSTKTMVLAANNELIVSNWFGQTSNNLYIYNATTLALIDSINAPQGVTSLLLDSVVLFANQNGSTGSPSFQDTLGSILVIDVANRNIVTTINTPSYTGDVGEIIAKANRSGLYTFNSVSNSINDVIYPTVTLPLFAATNVATNQNLKVGNRSQYNVYKDTVFLRMNQGIGSFNLNPLSLIDSNIVDTVVTAFTYDTLNSNFYITQTDFFSFTLGKIYDRNGNYLDTIPVGFSPEVIRMYYNQVTGIFETNPERVAVFSVFPNPAKNQFTIRLKEAVKAGSSVSIMNLNGQVVKKELINQMSTQLNVSELSSGIYFVTLQTGAEFFSHKLIIE